MQRASADLHFNRELDTVDALLRYVAGLPEDQQHPQEQQHTPHKAHEPGDIWLNLNGMPADSMFNGVYFNMSRAEQLQKLQVSGSEPEGQPACGNLPAAMDCLSSHRSFRLPYARVCLGSWRAG